MAYYVYKFGRTSFFTIIDEMLTFCTNKFGKISKASALLVSGIGGQLAIR
jgi:hypothetical protein